MTWVKIDDRFPEHPKAQVGAVGRDLFVSSLCYCNRLLTDGFVPEPMVLKLCDLSDFQSDLPGVDEIVTKLCDAGLWERVAGGFQVHDFLDYQPSKEKVRSSREQAKQRMENIRSRSPDVRANNQRTEPELLRKFEDPVPVPPTDPNAVEAREENSKLDSGLERVLSRVSDADETTLLLVEKLRRKGVPVGAFHSAYEALELRRGRKPALRSEAAYFVGALNDMLAEGQYA